MLESSPANMRFVQPGQRHWVIRQKARLEEIDLDSNFNLAAALFRLQHASSVEGMVSVLHKLSEWLPHVGDASLERDLSFRALAAMGATAAVECDACGSRALGRDGGEWRYCA